MAATNTEEKKPEASLWIKRFFWNKQAFYLCSQTIISPGATDVVTDVQKWQQKKKKSNEMRFLLRVWNLHLRVEGSSSSERQWAILVI